MNSADMNYPLWTSMGVDFWDIDFENNTLLLRGRSAAGIKAEVVVRYEIDDPIKDVINRALEALWEQLDV